MNVVTTCRAAAATLAQRLNAETVGNVEREITAIVHPRLATEESHLIYAPEAPALEALKAGSAKVALIGPDVEVSEALLEAGCGFIRVERPRYALALLSQWLDKPAHIEPGIHPTAVIDETAKIEGTVIVGPYVVIGPHVTIGEDTVLHAHVSIGGNTTIGANCLFHAGARVGDRVTIGNRVILQPNACIGSDGYSYVTPEKSTHETARGSGSRGDGQRMNRIERIQSLGTVVLEDEVEVGACTCIDRGTLAETRIAKGTKIDNLTQIGHNNQVGQNCLIVSQVGVSGSCKIGNGVVLAGQVGLADHLTVGDGALIMAKSGVMQDVPENEIVGGTPAMPRRAIGEQLVYLGKLKEMHKAIKSLTKQVETLQTELASVKQREEASV